jgi:hypothetical protein
MAAKEIETRGAEHMPERLIFIFKKFEIIFRHLPFQVFHSSKIAFGVSFRKCGYHKYTEQ